MPAGSTWRSPARRSPDAHGSTGRRPRPTAASRWPSTPSSSPAHLRARSRADATISRRLVALAQHQRTTDRRGRPTYGAYRRSPRPPRRRGRLAAAAVLLVLIVAGALVLLAIRASVSADSNALAKVSLPLGGKIESVSVVTGPHSGQVPVQLRGQRVWPRGLVGTHQMVSIEVVVKRAGWISWLAGSTQRLRLTLTTPNARLRDQFLTL